MGADLVEPHAFEDVCDGVAHFGGRCKREVDDAKRDAEALSSKSADELARTGDLERGLLDLLGDFVERRALERSDRIVNDTWARHADRDDGVWLFDAVECAGHERVVADRVGEDDELRTGDGGAVLGQFRRFLHNLAHLGHGVHVDAGARGCDVDGAADVVGLRQSFRDGVDQVLVGTRAALFYERRVATDKVHTKFGRCAIKCTSDLNRVALDTCSDECDRGD